MEDKKSSVNLLGWNWVTLVLVGSVLYMIQTQITRRGGLGTVIIWRPKDAIEAHAGWGGGGQRDLNGWESGHIGPISQP